MTTTAAAMPPMRTMLPEEDLFFFWARFVLPFSSEAVLEFADVDGDAWASGPCLGRLGNIPCQRRVRTDNAVAIFSIRYLLDFVLEKCGRLDQAVDDLTCGEVRVLGTD